MYTHFNLKLYAYLMFFSCLKPSPYYNTYSARNVCIMYCDLEILCIYIYIYARIDCVMFVVSHKYEIWNVKVQSYEQDGWCKSCRSHMYTVCACNHQNSRLKVWRWLCFWLWRNVRKQHYVGLADVLLEMQNAKFDRM